jgi:hypothetical protein
MKPFLFPMCLLLCICGYAGNFDFGHGARSAAMGNASVCLSDLWSAQNNQAGLGFFDQMTVGTFYENKFMLTELASKTLALALPIKGGTFGLTYNHFGYYNYAESVLGLAFGKKLTEKFSAGLRLDYLKQAFGGEFGSKSLVTFEFGIMYKLSEKLNIASHVFNPLQQQLSEDFNEKLPTIFKLGFAYYFSEPLFVICEAEKNSNLPLNIKSGLEYKINKKFVCRIGINTKPAQLSFGFGLNLKKIKIDLASCYHQQLGFSPQISIVYQIKK